MLGVFLIVMLLILGRVLHLPRPVTLMTIGLLWVGMLSLQVIAPGSAAAAAVGGSAAGWLVLGALVGLVVAYRGLLRRLRARATPDPVPVVRDDGLSDPELDRYARHLVLRQIGGAGQIRLKSARVLVIGAGGLGAPLCLYLA
ncbi:ThiF family adenylyltransferase, partial [Paracoccus nototheniae]